MDERDQILFGSTVLAYSIRRSSRRKKTVEVTLDPHEGVIVAVPAEAPCEQIRAVIKKRAPWIIRNASRQVLRARPRLFTSGESLPYLGRQARLFVTLADVERVVVQFDHWSFKLTLPSSLHRDERTAAIRKAIRRWYEKRAIERLRSRVEKWAKTVDAWPSSVLTRDQRSRWGSCSPDGTLRFNWRIVMAEPALIDYVVVHELAHLVVRTHSAEFWQLVARAIPDYKLRRARLKAIGTELVL